jgi:hypothetical protein
MLHSSAHQGIRCVARHASQAEKGIGICRCRETPSWVALLTFPEVVTPQFQVQVQVVFFFSHRYSFPPDYPPVRYRVACDLSQALYTELLATVFRRQRQSYAAYAARDSGNTPITAFPRRHGSRPQHGEEVWTSSHFSQNLSSVSKKLFFYLF